MIVPVYAIDGTATASTAPRSASDGRTTRRAIRKTGIAASDIVTAPIDFAAV